MDKPGRDEVIKEGMTNSAMVTSEENFQNVDKRNNSAEGKVMEDVAEGAKVIEVRGNDNTNICAIIIHHRGCNKMSSSNPLS